MLYFFHHYELPLILQQAHLQHLLLRTQTVPPASPDEASPNPPDGAPPPPITSSTITFTQTSPTSTVVQVTFQATTPPPPPPSETTAGQSVLDSHDIQIHPADGSNPSTESVLVQSPSGDSFEASPSNASSEPTKVPEASFSVKASKSLHSFNASLVGSPEATALPSSNFSPVFREPLADSLFTEAPEALPSLDGSKVIPETSLSTTAPEAPNTRHPTETPPDPPDLLNQQDTSS